MTGGEGRGRDAGGPGRDTRGEGSAFDRRVHGRSYPVPGRLDLKQALRAYVHGHDRGWDVERKAELASGQAADSVEPRRERGAGGGGPDADAAGEGRRYGVPVARSLSFRRAASTWRDRIPRPATSRRPAGWVGEGSADDRSPEED